MKRFRFPLDSVLRWREMHVEQEEAKLQKLFLEEQELAREIGRIRAEAAQAEQHLRASREIASAELRTLAAFRLYVEERLKTLAVSGAELKKKIDDQRRRVLEAERQFQLMQKLRGRRLAEWQYEFGRENDAFADEAYLARWIAKQRLDGGA
jgi:flagellar export protein FliJ